MDVIGDLGPAKAARFAIHLLDVGTEDYGDSLLVEAAGRRLLIDGGHQADLRGSPDHPAIPDQVRDILGESRPRIDLLVVTHCHLDHIGCLPELVPDLSIEWALVADPDLGWGQVIGQDAPLASDPTIDAVLSGLREELPTQPDRIDLSAFLSDAAALRPRYRGMLDALIAGGTTVVHHGVDDPAQLTKAFGPIGLSILGPSRTQLALCAQGINGTLRDAAQVAAEVVARGDAPNDPAALYRALAARPMSDASEARPGAFVNLQSVVVALELGGDRAFFGGDMQLAAPGTRDAQINAEIDSLRAAIRAHRPFQVVKLGHHGSPNAQDATVLDDLGTPPLVGITLGSGSANHPGKDVLDLLAGQAGTTWARTDHNGRSSISRTPAGWQVTPTRGVLNDAIPNRPVDAGGPSSRGAVPVPIALAAPQVEVSTVSSQHDGSALGLTMTIPDGVERVRVDLEIVRSVPGQQPAPRPIQVETTSEAPMLRAPNLAIGDLVIGGGRDLPPLLFVTDSAALARNIGAAEAQALSSTLAKQKGRVLDLAGGASASVIRAEAAVHDAIGSDPSLAGVVLVGGYDVVPSHVIDTLPSSLEARVSRSDDPDRFIVWTDDVYGRPNLTGKPDPNSSRPVSRVLDGRSAETLFSSLGAGLPMPPRARGVRNVARPFAADIFKPLPSAQAMDISQPIDTHGLGVISSDLIYLMLHGSDLDGSRFWGEDGAGGYVEAFSVNNVGNSVGSIVLAGACWGALPVEVPARSWQPGAELASRQPASSIAVRYLAAGASAFVGCTGSHYSPGRGAPNTMGSPIHRAFWSGVLGGKRPALALHDAKLDYLGSMPHGLTDPTLQAYESKMLWQFTCLGLGW